MIGRRFHAWQALGVTLLAGCGSSTEAGGKDLSSYRVLFESARADTVLAHRTLVIEALDSEGNPLALVPVEFRAVPEDRPPEQSTFWLAHLRTGVVAGRQLDTTDASGRAGVIVDFGPRPGRSQLVVALGTLQPDTIELETSPGAPATVRVLPRDSAVHPGASLPLTVTVMDQTNNLLDATVAWTVEDPAVASVSPSAVLRGGSRPGNTRVIAAAGLARDTIAITTTPPGTLAVYLPHGEQLATVDLDGSSFQAIASARSRFWSVSMAWLPDGGSLVASIAGANSQEVVRVYPTGLIRSLTARPSNELIDAVWPSVTRDGNWVYFVGLGVVSGWGAWRVSPLSDSPEKVAVPAWDPGTLWAAEVSPDGLRLAVAQEPGGERAQMATLDLPAGTLSAWRRFGAAAPAWSPDGGRLAYIEPVTGLIRLTNRDGTGDRALTPATRPYGYQRLAWSPDGSWIAVRGETRLELIEVATGRRVELPFSGAMLAPAWKP